MRFHCGGVRGTGKPEFHAIEITGLVPITESQYQTAFEHFLSVWKIPDSGKRDSPFQFLEDNTLPAKEFEPEFLADAPHGAYVESDE